MLNAVLEPFIDFAFMRRSLFGCVALAISVAPIGVFLILRRMSLIGDAIAHGILPGAALALWLVGLSIPGLLIGGLFAGLLMAWLSAWVTRHTGLREETSLAAIYPISLASGVLILSFGNQRLDLVHMLFGSALAVDQHTLQALLIISATSLVLMSVIYRHLLLDSFDAVFLRHVSRWGPPAYAVFLVLVVLNLVIGFQAIGALMVVGLMILPAAAARFWSRHLPWLILLAVVIGIFSVWGGLLLSYYAGLPSGACIVLLAGLFYISSVVFGSVNGLTRSRQMIVS